MTSDIANHISRHAIYRARVDLLEAYELYGTAVTLQPHSQTLAKGSLEDAEAHLTNALHELGFELVPLVKMEAAE